MRAVRDVAMRRQYKHVTSRSESELGVRCEHLSTLHNQQGLNPAKAAVEHDKNSPAAVQEVGREERTAVPTRPCTDDEVF